MPERRSERDKMLAGELYLANDLELAAARKRAKVLCARYNLGVEELDREALAELLGCPPAPDVHLEPPFFCDYGHNIRLGAGVYANHNLVILDCALVTIGDGVFMGPNVVLATAAHPTDPAERTTGLEFARPITIRARAWLGAGALVMPGVEIGEGTTIGAGSVVTRSIPADCIAVGNPCRVLRRV